MSVKKEMKIFWKYVFSENHFAQSQHSPRERTTLDKDCFNSKEISCHNRKFCGIFGYRTFVFARVTITKLPFWWIERRGGVLKYKYHRYPEVVCVRYNLANTFSPLSTDFWLTTILSSIQLSQSLRVIVLSASSKKFFQLFQTVAIFFNRIKTKQIA